MITTAIIASCAVALDWVFGEPKRLHPLVGFGWLADQIEGQLNRFDFATPTTGNFSGLISLVLLIAPFAVIAALLVSLSHMGLFFSIIILYLAIGHRSLYDHARPIADRLASGNEAEARRLTGRIVSRDPATLNIPVAATESVLENGSDSIFAALFWFVILGAPGVVIYRLVNTLDAMWGYRTDRYQNFGWAAAKLDDALNYIPARLTALTYAIIGAILLNPVAARFADGAGDRFTKTINAWRTQAPLWDSPNAGPVMAAGAGALGVSLGGAAIYNGQRHDRPVLGFGPEPDALSIMHALKLVSYSLILWLVIIGLVEFLIAGGHDFGFA